MRNKVSVVIPCYNKDRYIGRMLDSILTQKWNDVEVILINDGSTDKTREVLASYEPKLIARGYDAVIAHQENAGCCAAVHAGLLRVHGDYVCIVDADDELDEGYISTMAGWLAAHDDCDYCSCDYLTFRYKDGKQKVANYIPHVWPKETYTPEFFFCNDHSKAAWAFMTRTSYLKKCRLPEAFYTQTRGSYEPSFFVPFTLYGGRMKHFELPLYRYLDEGDGMSKHDSFIKAGVYWREYHRVALLMLDNVPGEILGFYKRRYLCALSSFYTLKLLLLRSLWTQDGASKTECLRRDLLAFINHWLCPEPLITYDDICLYPALLCRAAELGLSGMWREPPKKGGRIIGHGALGKAAANRLPRLNGTVWEPTELWDKNADGIMIKKPEISSLNENDVVLIFPTAQNALTEIKEEFDGCPASLLFARQIDDLPAQAMFPQLAGSKRHG